MVAQTDPDRYSLIQQLMVIAMVMATMMPATLQPVLLGALVREHQINTVQLGQAATAEQLGMAFTAFCAGAWLRPVRLKPILAAALLLCIAANIATSFLAGPQIIFARLASGLAAGMSIWLLISMAARVEWPARFIGMYVTGQSITALLLSTVLSYWLLPDFGVAAGFQAVAALILLATVAILAIPSKLSELPASRHGWIPPAAGVLGLLLVLLYMGAGLSIWVYIIPLATASGFTASIANYTVSAGFAAQMLGGLAATQARRLAPPATLVTCAAVGLAAGATIMLTGVSSLFVVAGFLYCFGLTLGISFHIPFLELVDPSRRAALLCGSAQLLGQSFGLYCTSAAVGWQGTYGATYTGMTLLLLVITMVFVSIAFSKARNARLDGHLVQEVEL